MAAGIAKTRFAGIFRNHEKNTGERHTQMLVFLTMLAMGALIGFVGAGGAGVVIAVLTLVFNIPIHTAVGTSLAAMIFTTLSGAFSHFREGNLNIKVGLTVGLAGAAGAFIGSKISTLLPGTELKYCTASMLVASAIRASRVCARSASTRASSASARACSATGMIEASVCSSVSLRE